MTFSYHTWVNWYQLVHVLRILLIFMHHTARLWPLGTRVYKTPTTSCKQYKQIKKKIQAGETAKKLPQLIQYATYKQRNC